MQISNSSRARLSPLSMALEGPQGNEARTVWLHRAVRAKIAALPADAVAQECARLRAARSEAGHDAAGLASLFRDLQAYAGSDGLTGHNGSEQHVRYARLRYCLQTFVFGGYEAVTELCNGAATKHFGKMWRKEKGRYGNVVQLGRRYPSLQPFLCYLDLTQKVGASTHKLKPASQNHAGLPKQISQEIYRLQLRPLIVVLCTQGMEAGANFASLLLSGARSSPHLITATDHTPVVPAEMTAGEMAAAGPSGKRPRPLSNSGASSSASASSDGEAAAAGAHSSDSDSDTDSDSSYAASPAASARPLRALPSRAALALRRPRPAAAPARLSVSLRTRRQRASIAPAQATAPARPAADAPAPIAAVTATAAASPMVAATLPLAFDTQLPRVQAASYKGKGPAAEIIDLTQEDDSPASACSDVAPAAIRAQPSVQPGARVVAPVGAPVDAPAPFFFQRSGVSMTLHAAAAQRLLQPRGAGNLDLEERLSVQWNGQTLSLSMATARALLHLDAPLDIGAAEAPRIRLLNKAGLPIARGETQLSLFRQDWLQVLADTPADPGCAAPVVAPPAASVELLFNGHYLRSDVLSVRNVAK